MKWGVFETNDPEADPTMHVAPCDLDDDRTTHTLNENCECHPHYDPARAADGTRPLLIHELTEQPLEPPTLAVRDSVHETVRAAIEHCDGNDQVVLKLQSAMDLIREWDVYVGKYGTADLDEFTKMRKVEVAG